MDVRLTLVPMAEEKVAAQWARLMQGLNPPEAHYGPEFRTPRPRPQDRYYDVLADHADVAAAYVVGLAYTQAPSPSTRVFGLGLYEEHRGKRLGALLQAACLDLCFRNPYVHKVETEVYASNRHSLGALHGRYGCMIEEGRQRGTIMVEAQPIDRILFGMTRAEWEAAMRVDGASR
jgi:RimJ/RimL family protein N-acetyltransferase